MTVDNGGERLTKTIIFCKILATGRGGAGGGGAVGSLSNPFPKKPYKVNNPRIFFDGQ